MTPSAPPAAGAVLTVDLDAIAANYRILRAAAPGAEAAGVVKADAYGLGADRVASALWRAGCRTFFVALPDEAVALRSVLPEEAVIAVLSGPMPGTAEALAAHRLTPVLNELAQIDAWRAVATAGVDTCPAILHLDTGMNRLGLGAGELQDLLARPTRLSGINMAFVMSHLACAEAADHPMNAAQLAAFRTALGALRSYIGAAKASLANSAGIFLSADYHFDLTRPGIALYGGNRPAADPDSIRQVVHLHARILQHRDIDSPMTVGYGAAHRASGPARVATVALGYADGYLRSLSARGRAYVGDRPVPILGRISMDLVTLDVSGVAPAGTRTGAWVEMIGDHLPIDDVAAAAGTIGYEILTALGHRYHRTYIGEGS